MGQHRPDRGPPTAATAEYEITEFLELWRSGRSGAAERLIPLVYAELRRAAQQQRRRGREDGTLTTTALVHEPYLRLIDESRANWRDRHFFAATHCLTPLQLQAAAWRRWAVIEPLIDAALDLAPAERNSYLLRAIGEDGELRAAVEQLLLAAESAEDYLSLGVAAAFPALRNSM